MTALTAHLYLCLLVQENKGDRHRQVLHVLEEIPKSECHLAFIKPIAGDLAAASLHKNERIELRWLYSLYIIPPVLNNSSDRTAILWKDNDDDEVRHYPLCYFFWITAEFSLSRGNGPVQKIFQRLKGEFGKKKRKEMDDTYMSNVMTLTVLDHKRVINNCKQETSIIKTS
jgi:hypothetical protein